jgi:hypothetical protein
VTDFAAWLRPTILGPFVTSWAFATLGSVLGMQHVLGQRFDSWVTAMLFASFFAAGVVVLLIVADVVLLQAKKRMLPTGERAWTSSCFAPLATMGLWMIWPAPVDSIPLIAIAIVVPMIAAAFATRLLFGRRP